MKFVSFNIQYGMGLDGKFDLQRITDAIRDADIIALQEVTRNLPKNSRADLPALIAALLPEFFHAFGAGTVTDAGSGLVDGKVIMRQIEFGNMVLSRHPILATRNILLPRSRTYDRLNLQRSALEALIDTPTGRSGSIQCISIIAARRSASARSPSSRTGSSTTHAKAAR